MQFDIWIYFVIGFFAFAIFIMLISFYFIKRSFDKRMQREHERVMRSIQELEERARNRSSQ